MPSMGSHSQTTEQIVVTFAEVLEDITGESPADLGSATPLESLDLDSLSLLELIGALEREFGVQLPENTVGSTAVVGDVVTLIREAYR